MEHKLTVCDVFILCFTLQFTIAEFFVGGAQSVACDGSVLKMREVFGITLLLV